eukprot:scaffold88262_cov87-Phaeocystis_antarctica.AAC.1
MQRRCDMQAHGLAPGAARARQRVKGEAAPSSRRATPCKRHGAGGAAACARARDGARRIGVARLRVGATKERAQPPICNGVNMSAGETTTLAHFLTSIPMTQKILRRATGDGGLLRLERDGFSSF